MTTEDTDRAVCNKCGCTVLDGEPSYICVKDHILCEGCLGKIVADTEGTADNNGCVYPWFCPVCRGAGTKPEQLERILKILEEHNG